MTLLVDVVVRSSAILAVILVVLPFLRRRSAALRHGVLAGAMAASAVVVPLSFALPAWTVEVPPTIAATLADTAAPCRTHSLSRSRRLRRGSPPATLLAALWAIGVAIGVGLLVASFLRLHRIVVRAGRRARWAVAPRRRRRSGIGRPSPPPYPLADRQAGRPGDVGRVQATDPAAGWRATEWSRRGSTRCSATRSPTSSARTGSCSWPPKGSGRSTGSTPSTGLRAAGCGAKANKPAMTPCSVSECRLPTTLSISWTSPGVAGRRHCPWPPSCRWLVPQRSNGELLPC